MWKRNVSPILEQNKCKNKENRKEVQTIFIILFTKMYNQQNLGETTVSEKGKISIVRYQFYLNFNKIIFFQLRNPLMKVIIHLIPLMYIINTVFYFFVALVTYKIPEITEFFIENIKFKKIYFPLMYNSNCVLFFCGVDNLQNFRNHRIFC